MCVACVFGVFMVAAVPLDPLDIGTRYINDRECDNIYTHDLNKAVAFVTLKWPRFHPLR